MVPEGSRNGNGANGGSGGGGPGSGSRSRLSVEQWDGFVRQVLSSPLRSQADHVDISVVMPLLLNVRLMAIPWDKVVRWDMLRTLQAAAVWAPTLVALVAAFPQQTAAALQSHRPKPRGHSSGRPELDVRCRLVQCVVTICIVMVRFVMGKDTRRAQLWGGSIPPVCTDMRAVRTIVSRSVYEVLWDAAGNASMTLPTADRGQNARALMEMLKHHGLVHDHRAGSATIERYPPVSCPCAPLHVGLPSFACLSNRAVFSEECARPAACSGRK